ncbi:DUF6446 family protein [Pseudaestuariivita sp.]|uniref:DUF6446 family protein n=1 Tax=Pseudaestuariivita sp. TaxID=2211669 RepID=UPI0040594F2F
MMGRVIVVGMVLIALVAGAAMYYLQVYGFYEEIDSADRDPVLLTTLSGETQTLNVTQFQAIDAESSPIRYRACFTTDARPGALAETFETLPRTFPRTAPPWFECFDAEALGAALSAGTAQAFMGVQNLEFGIDRIVAVTEDGRGYIWHDINDCGDKAYDGTPLGDDCPERETN